mmetsp:Transcript_1481/g.4358  ORF Transcript_1481/g.4358 Transcript_1481/m.4358 type:complete len:131 (+) Transcript_1481:202-594(+)
MLTTTLRVTMPSIVSSILLTPSATRTRSAPRSLSSPRSSFDKPGAYHGKLTRFVGTGAKGSYASAFDGTSHPPFGTLRELGPHHPRRDGSEHEGGGDDKRSRHARDGQLLDALLRFCDAVSQRGQAGSLS